MEKQLFFRAAMARFGKYSTGGYRRIGVYIGIITLRKTLEDKGQP